MVADGVKNVAGEHAELFQLMRERVDPHTYKSTPGDTSRLRKADIIFYSGLHLEGKMADNLHLLSRTKPTFAVTERLPKDKILRFSGEFPDPHVWFDVSLWSEAVAEVERVMMEFDPARAADYKTHGDAYRQELAALHEECKVRLATIPRPQRVLVTAHDAFHYFGRAYDVEVKAIQGVSTESEAGVKQINELVTFIVDRKIKAVFVETSVSDRFMRSLIEGCQHAGHDVVIGGELYSDAMGDPATPEGTYVGMVRHNVETIVKALR